ncbi:Cystathionine gamma-lyase [Hondaea fermentalgiana]|uniref:Cystathionine gamma-lyase n=1 Tax=Hondaea fermentalgiana TaxID=2315210 RepID=A0A2R5GBI7_9STRA|nr:Cystathionine gamma-lyase [Hondaea fermentalgiana]|eukprot:GBG25491.1 Cystathionine gamma-lyase [Hondaea fermentalgiana]
MGDGGATTNAGRHEATGADARADVAHDKATSVEPEEDKGREQEQMTPAQVEMNGEETNEGAMGWTSDETAASVANTRGKARNDSDAAESANSLTTSPVLNRQSGSDLVIESMLLDPKRQRFSAVPEDDYNQLPTYPLRPSYKEYHEQLRPASRPVVFDGCPDNPYRPCSVPIYQTSTYEQPKSTEFGPYDYTRSGNPTRTALEKQVAMLEHAHAAFAFSTGMAALNCVTRLLQSGDCILVGSDIYGGFHRLVSRVTSLYNVRVRFVETWDLQAVERALEAESNVRMLHIETPSNPLMKVSDLRALSDLLARHNVLLSVDNTMMSPHLQVPINHGAQIVVHSMTKFFGGHSDTMGGIVCVSNEELAQKIAFFQNAEGSGLGPFDCWLFLRGIKTLAIRVERAQENAEHIAAFLRRQPLVKDIYYAGLEPGQDQMRKHVQAARDYKVHMGQAKGGGSLMSFTTGSVDVSRRIIDALRLFKLTVSFGSCNSLCEMPSTLSHASIPAHLRTLPDDLIRLSIGIEDVNDLIEDLQQALSLAASSYPLPPRDRSSSMHRTRVVPDLPEQPSKATFEEEVHTSTPQQLGKKLRTLSNKLSTLMTQAGSSQNLNKLAMDTANGFADYDANTPGSQEGSASAAAVAAVAAVAAADANDANTRVAIAMGIAAFMGGVSCALLLQPLLARHSHS